MSAPPAGAAAAAAVASLSLPDRATAALAVLAQASDDDLDTVLQRLESGGAMGLLSTAASATSSAAPSSAAAAAIAWLAAAVVESVRSSSAAAAGSSRALHDALVAASWTGERADRVVARLHDPMRVPLRRILTAAATVNGGSASAAVGASAAVPAPAASSLQSVRWRLETVVARRSAPHPAPGDASVGATRYLLRVDGGALGAPASRFITATPAGMAALSAQLETASRASTSRQATRVARLVH